MGPGEVGEQVRVLELLGPEAVRHWCTVGREGLAAAQVEIDDLNVYPVPDGDTGTNLLLTMQAVEQSVLAAAADCGATADALSHGSLMGARGNSGVILSQLLRGLAEVIGQGPLDGERLAQGLTRAAELAYAAVALPVEGTLLTVARESAAAAQAAAVGPLASLAVVVRAARTEAAASLARTPSLLAQLAAAGVVDAGGRGWCVLLDALETVVSGAPGDPALVVPRGRSGQADVREQGSDAFGYEVQFLLRDATDDAVVALRSTLAGLGDSLVVVGGDGLWNVHVHVNDVGAAVEAGVEAGRPFRITITRFADQIAARAPAAQTRAVVTVTPGAGLAELFRSAGAVVVAGGPGARPSTADLVAALASAGAAELVLLPNDADSAGVATAAAQQARRDGLVVAVVPTRSVLQGLAAVAVADPSRPFADDVAAMAEAAGSTHHGGVTVAVREAATSAGVCRPGDVLGVLDGDVVVIGEGLEQVAQQLVTRLLSAGGELFTVVTGEDAPAGLGERLVEWIERTAPTVEVVAYEGGQPRYPLLLGVE